MVKGFWTSHAFVTHCCVSVFSLLVQFIFVQSPWLRWGPLPHNQTTRVQAFVIVFYLFLINNKQHDSLHLFVCFWFNQISTLKNDVENLSCQYLGLSKNVRAWLNCWIHVAMETSFLIHNVYKIFVKLFCFVFLVIQNVILISFRLGIIVASQSIFLLPFLT